MKSEVIEKLRISEIMKKIEGKKRRKEKLGINRIMSEELKNSIEKRMEKEGCI